MNQTINSYQAMRYRNNLMGGSPPVSMQMTHSPNVNSMNQNIINENITNISSMNTMMHPSHIQYPQQYSQSPQYPTPYQNTNSNNTKQKKKYNNNSNSNNNQTNNIINNNNNKGPTQDTWKSPYRTNNDNLKFFMFQYKVDPCPQRRNCQSKVTCRGWHHEGEKRRNPMPTPNTVIYSEEPCPNVKSQGSNKWKQPHLCADGDSCPYSHTLLEQMYHPNIYKTSMCINYTNPTGNKCQWGYYCTHAHGHEDIRSPKATPNKDSKDDNNDSKTNTSIENKDTQNKNSNKNDDTKVDPIHQRQTRRIRASSDGDSRYGYDMTMSNRRTIQSQFSPQQEFYTGMNHQNMQQLQGQRHIIDLNNHSPMGIRSGYQSNFPPDFRLQNAGYQITQQEMNNNPYLHEDAIIYQNPYSYHQNYKIQHIDTNIQPITRSKRSFSDSDFPKSQNYKNWTSQIGGTDETQVIPEQIDLPSLNHVISPVPNEYEHLLSLSPRVKQNKKNTSNTPPPPPADLIKKQKKKVNDKDEYKSRKRRTVSLPVQIPNELPPSNPEMEIKLSTDSTSHVLGLMSPNDKKSIQYFGFLDTLSPTQLANYTSKSNHRPKDLPATPPPVLRSRKSEKKINQTNKFVYIENPKQDNQTSKDDSKNASDNEERKNTQENDDTDSIGLAPNEHLDEQNRGRLKSYWHIVLCPGCESAENQRNQVLIPCGHLVCSKCSENMKQCCVCDGEVKNIQVLQL